MRGDPLLAQFVEVQFGDCPREQLKRYDGHFGQAPGSHEPYLLLQLRKLLQQRLGWLPWQLAGQLQPAMACRSIPGNEVKASIALDACSLIIRSATQVTFDASLLLTPSFEMYTAMALVFPAYL